MNDIKISLESVFVTDNFEGLRSVGELNRHRFFVDGNVFCVKVDLGKKLFLKVTIIFFMTIFDEKIKYRIQVSFDSRKSKFLYEPKHHRVY